MSAHRDRRDQRPPAGHRRAGPGARRRAGVRRRLQGRPARPRPGARRRVVRADRGRRRRRGVAAADPRCGCRSTGSTRSNAARRAAASRRRRDGVFPDDFYSTTNLETVVRLDGQLASRSSGPRWTAGWSSPPAGCAPCRSSDVRAGDAGRLRRDRRAGRAARHGRARPTADASASCPRRCPARSRRRCWCGRSPSGCARSRPRAARSSGSAARRSCTPERRPRWSRWSGPGYVDVLFAGNALATHDIEAALYGTSLGVDLDRGAGVPHGHEHHIRAINRIRRGRLDRAPRSSRAC